MNLLSADLQRCMPSCPPARIELFRGPLEAAMTQGDITAPLRAAAFLAQIGHESVDLRYTKEINGEKARYAPWFGRGLIQVTWKTNYVACGAALGRDFVTHPELLEQPEDACLAAVWFWTSRSLNIAADRGDIDTISRRINGGDNGLEDRRHRYTRCLAVMSTPTVVV